MELFSARDKHSGFMASLGAGDVRDVEQHLWGGVLILVMRAVQVWHLNTPGSLLMLLLRPAC